MSWITQNPPQTSFEPSWRELTNGTNHWNLALTRSPEKLHFLPDRLSLYTAVSISLAVGSLAWCLFSLGCTFDTLEADKKKICFLKKRKLCETTFACVKVQECLAFMASIKVFCSSWVMQISCESAVRQCPGYRSLTLMDFLGHICNSVCISRD